MTHNNETFASPKVWYWIMSKLTKKHYLSHWLSHMGNEICTVRFPHKIHQRRVSFVTNVIITILVKICCIEIKFVFEFCFCFIYQSFCKSVIYWFDKNKPICCSKKSKNGNCFENFVCKNQLVTFSKRRVSFCNSHIVTNIKLWFLYQFCWIVCIYWYLSRHMYLRDVVWS